MNSHVSHYYEVVVISVGEKIRYYRLKAEMTQDELAKKVNCSRTYLSKVEKNIINPSEDILTNLKEILKMNDVAISNEDVESIKNNLLEWYSLIKNRCFDDVYANKDNLENLVKVSMETEFEILFSLFSFRLYLAEGNLDKANSLLNEVNRYKKVFSGLTSYYYHLFMGIYSGIQNDDNAALSFFLKAEQDDASLKLEEVTLLYNISNAYSRMDHTIKAIYYATLALEKSKSKNENTHLPEIQMIMGINYGRIGEYKIALKLLNDALFQINKTKNKYLLYMIYNNIAWVKSRSGLYDEAMDYFMRAFNYCGEGDGAYANNVLSIAYNFFVKNDAHSASFWIDKGLDIPGIGSDMQIRFKSIKCALSINDYESRKYIESTTVPMLLKEKQYLRLIDYLNILKAYYMTRGFIEQAFKYSNLLNECFNFILKGGQ